MKDQIIDTYKSLGNVRETARLCQVPEHRVYRIISKAALDFPDVIKKKKLQSIKQDIIKEKGTW
jgi:hypothetical protein